MLVAVFDNDAKAREGLAALQALRESDTIALVASAVVTKSPGGAITVLQTDGPVPEAALGGTAVGALIGILGGPIGLAFGAVTGLALGVFRRELTDVADEDYRKDVAALKRRLK